MALKYLCVRQTEEGIKALCVTEDTVEEILKNPANARWAVFEVQTEGAIHTLVDNATWVPVPGSN